MMAYPLTEPLVSSRHLYPLIAGYDHHEYSKDHLEVAPNALLFAVHGH